MTKAIVSPNHDEDQTEATPDATTKPDEARIETWVLFTRNLQHYPMQRDPRTKLPAWKKFKNTGRYFCDLSDEIQIRYPADSERQQLRAPSGLGIRLLLVLLREHAVSKNCELHLNNAGLLRKLRLSNTGYNVGRLQQELDTLSKVELRHRKWRADGVVQSQILKPPIRKKMSNGKGHVIDAGHLHVIEMNAEWCDKSYCTRLPLDLPNDAVASCLLMLIWAHPVEDITSRERRGARNLPKLYRKLGLRDTRNNRRSLQNGIDKAIAWMKEHGGDLTISIDNNTMSFTANLPKVGNKQLKEQRAEERLQRQVRRESDQKEKLQKAREKEEFRKSLRNMNYNAPTIGEDIPYDTTGTEFE